MSKNNARRGSAIMPVRVIGQLSCLWWTQSERCESAILVKFAIPGSIIQDLIVFTPGNHVQYRSFLAAIGVTTDDIKSKMTVALDDDELGTPIEAISGWRPGEFYEVMLDASNLTITRWICKVGGKYMFDGTPKRKKRDRVKELEARVAELERICDSMIITVAAKELEGF